jgi:hypothetical protein
MLRMFGVFEVLVRPGHRRLQSRADDEAKHDASQAL